VWASRKHHNSPPILVNKITKVCVTSHSDDVFCDIDDVIYLKMKKLQTSPKFGDKYKNLAGVQI
jgi:hypothetical protein